MLNYLYVPILWTLSNLKTTVKKIQQPGDTEFFKVCGYSWKRMKKVENGWKQQKTVENGWNRWKSVETVENKWKGLKTLDNGWKLLRTLENGWILLKTVVNSRNWLKTIENGKFSEFPNNMLLLILTLIHQQWWANTKKLSCFSKAILDHFWDKIAKYETNNLP